MPPIRSVLWIGRGERFAADLVADAPTLDVVWEGDAHQAARLAGEPYHAIVLDADDAETALASLAGLETRAPVLVRIAPSDARRLPELLAAGAADVALRAGPTSDAELLERIERLATTSGRASAAAPPEIVAASPEMAKVFGLVAVAARSRATVLLTGETGTGKEVVARAIHRAGPRRDQAFVGLNCAAFPDTLLEGELFGHKRGAFTGADRDRRGLFEAAHGGTLFLDEVAETSRPFQAKLLRALQEREVRPLGGTRTRRVDVRVIAATNRELRREAREGRFREDLYYRLAVFPIDLPPLRERSADVLPLARHFAALHGGGARVRFTREAERLLLSHAWPGNVRELENEMQRALAMAEPGEALAPSHFSERITHALAPVESQVQPGDTLRETLDRLESYLLRRALDAHGGHRARTAKSLGITREGLYKKMKRLGIE